MDDLIIKLSEEFDDLKEELRPLFLNPFGIHGLSHAKRVFILAMLLSEKEKLDSQDRSLLRTAAMYHDIGRTHDGICYIHGTLSFKKFSKLGLMNKKDPGYFILRFIFENHCVDDEHMSFGGLGSSATVGGRALQLLRLFKDADGLDRVRLGDLDAAYLRTGSARELVPVAYDLLRKFR